MIQTNDYPQIINELQLKTNCLRELSSNHDRYNHWPCFTYFIVGHRAPSLVTKYQNKYEMISIKITKTSLSMSYILFVIIMHQITNKL